MSSKVLDGAVKVFATRCHWERPVAWAPDSTAVSLISPLAQPHLAMAAIVTLKGLRGKIKIVKFQD
jgi:hypothetical protein